MAQRHVQPPLLDCLRVTTTTLVATGKKTGGIIFVIVTQHPPLPPTLVRLHGTTLVSCRCCRHNCRPPAGHPPPPPLETFLLGAAGFDFLPMEPTDPMTLCHLLTLGGAGGSRSSKAALQYLSRSDWYCLLVGTVAKVVKTIGGGGDVSKQRHQRCQEFGEGSKGGVL